MSRIHLLDGSFDRVCRKETRKVLMKGVAIAITVWDVAKFAHALSRSAEVWYLRVYGISQAASSGV
jgi:hypothetical protein